MSKSTETTRINSLDGIRALAVSAVIGLHLQIFTGIFSGGAGGVTIFFVLSGFLITSGIIHEHNKTRNFNLKNFYSKRIARLAPAMLVVLTIIAALVFIKPGGATASRELFLSTLPGSLGQFLNIKFAGGETPLAYELVPTWSLNIEEQFYIMWSAIVALAVWKTTNLRKTLFIAATTGALLSILQTVNLVNNNAPAERIMYGTDTQISAMLTGCALACIPAQWFKQHLPKNLIAGTTTAGFAFVIFALSGTTTLTYPYMNVILVLSTTALIVGLVNLPNSLISKALSIPLLLWIGSRSYAIYLLHVTTMQFFGGPGDTTRTLTVLIVTFTLAETMYRFVEKPIINANHKRILGKTIEKQKPSKKLENRVLETI